MNRLTAPSCTLNTKSSNKPTASNQVTDQAPTMTTNEAEVNDDVNMQEDTSEFEAQENSDENKTVSDCLNVVEKIKETLVECQAESNAKESRMTEIQLDSLENVSSSASS